MRRRRIFKYSKLHFFLSYIVELIILLLVNFILEKSFTYCTYVHHISEKGINISLCFKEVYDFMLGHTHCSAGARVRQPCSRDFVKIFL